MDISIIFFPVPLLGIVAALFFAAMIFHHQHRRLKRRMDVIERFINNMDRWADGIEDRLEECERERRPRLPDYSGNKHFANNENAYY